MRESNKSRVQLDLETMEMIEGSEDKKEWEGGMRIPQMRG